jgi:hypothetical protein
MTGHTATFLKVLINYTEAILALHQHPVGVGCYRTIRVKYKKAKEIICRLVAINIREQSRVMVNNKDQRSYSMSWNKQPPLDLILDPTAKLCNHLEIGTFFKKRIDQLH